MRWLFMAFKFDPLTPVIVLDVEIEGSTEKTTKRMAFDTGATYILLPWEVAELIGYEDSKEKTTLITASGVELAPIVTLKSVAVLGKKVKNVKAVIHDLPPRSYVDGLLGLSFLRNFNINLNFKEATLELV